MIRLCAYVENYSTMEVIVIVVLMQFASEAKKDKAGYSELAAT